MGLSLVLINKWNKKRNEIIHAMFNKSMSDFDLKIKNIAIDGRNLFSYYSKICNKLKKIINETNFFNNYKDFV